MNIEFFNLQINTLTGRMRVPRGWERTQLTPLPRFTTDHSTYEHGSTSGSTNVHTNEECDQNSNRGKSKLFISLN